MSQVKNMAIEIPGNAEAQAEGEIGKQKDTDKDLIANRRRQIKLPLRFRDPPDQPPKRKRKRKCSVSSDEQANCRIDKLLKNLVQGESRSKIMGSSSNPSCSAAAEGSNPSQGGFNAGDIVWVVSNLKNMPTWPGTIIDFYKEDLPPSVLSVYYPGTLCVMLFGPSFKEVGENEKDYVWARPKMIFPFLPCLEKFQDEFASLHPNKRSSTDFRLAIEEASLGEYGSGLVKSLPERNSSAEDEMGFREANMYLYKQFCGICRRVCSDYETDRGSWLNCHKCDVWCHSGCDPDSSKYQEAEYMCPKCQLYFEVAEKNKIMVEQGEDWVGVENDKVFCAPYRLTVVCGDMEADYLPNHHLVLCECIECDRGYIMSIGDWELHTGCTEKNWETSVTVKGINVSLIDWLNELHKAGVGGLAHFFNPEVGEAPRTSKERDLIVDLLGIYEPYKVSWSIVTCAVCFSNQDDDQNKIIICKTCQIAVHQDCYGAGNVGDEALASWVCRACETPAIKRECCLCPVVGGALKPTTTLHFWVHVTCAWLVKEVVFPDEDTMEPADGILRVDGNSFKKTCVICNQIHGSCIQCCRCPRSFHAMCAALAGYWIQLSIFGKDKSGRDVGKWISYCSVHKTPNSQNPPGLILGPQKEKLCTNKKLKEQQVTDSIPTHTPDQGEEETQGEGETQGKDELPTASRCRAWPYSYKKEGKAVFHRPMGYSRHSPQVMETINSFNQQAEFSSFKERLRHALENERKRVCVGKSGIHGFGLFARTPILQGEMVIEYREDNIIDATKKGNMARLLNHSCNPNLYAKIIDGEERIELIAARDITAGEELCFDYNSCIDGEDAAGQEADKVPCHCGAPACRKYM
ncbi:hypothetical protein SUGI_0659150 [Cryptomeria japonica]|nr:hypothetical protein SUGI_0659150 [Cryptomeria japonica]